MNFLNTEIGSAKDNQKSPIHNWYKFTAGFSFKFVDEIIKLENLKDKKTSEIFDPFAGCGTTLVSSQKEGIKAVGNEAQRFMYEIIKAKLNWNLEEELYNSYKALIKNTVEEKRDDFNIEINAHPLLLTLYKKKTLTDLYLIKYTIEKILIDRYRLFFKLALSQTLHKVPIHPIAVPYISRNKILSGNRPAIDVFLEICHFMFNDLILLKEKQLTSKIYKHDSRKINQYIDNGQCNVCITSPPYLNNLDYGEVSKVHTHFFGMTNSWNNITSEVRKKLVTSATTHYVDSDFILDDFLKSEFSIVNNNIIKELVKNFEIINNISKERSGKKSFHILMLLYFSDMYLVLKEIRRVLRKDSKAYLILGDSAPYGIYINTTQMLGKISKNIGFNEYRIHKIRDRGTKWKTLKYRHNIELSENVLVLR